MVWKSSVSDLSAQGGGDSDDTYEDTLTGGGDSSTAMDALIGGGGSLYGAKGLLYSMADGRLYLAGDALIDGTVTAGKSVKDIDTDAIVSSDLGSLAYDDVVEQAKLGTTVIDGGHVTTELLTDDDYDESNPSGALSIDLNNSVIKTDNFVTGSEGSGWQISGDGSVEFNDGIFRGEIYASAGTFTGTINGTGGIFSGFIQSTAIKTEEGGDDIHTETFTEYYDDIYDNQAYDIKRWIVVTLGLSSDTFYSCIDGSYNGYTIKGIKVGEATFDLFDEDERAYYIYLYDQNYELIPSSDSVVLPGCSAPSWASATIIALRQDEGHGICLKMGEMLKSDGDVEDLEINLGGDIVKFINLPQTDPNEENQLWSDGGIVKISTG